MINRTALVFLKGNLASIACATHQLRNGRKYYTTASENNFYDVVVAGGGIAGFAAASSLGQSPFFSDKKILLLEEAPLPKLHRFPEEWRQSPYNIRVSSIAPLAIRLLDKLGAWKEILSVRTGPVTNIQVWEDETESFITFGDGQESLFHVVENDLIIQCLRRSLPDSVKVMYGSSAESYLLPKDLNELAVVTLKGGQNFTTKLVVGCDGANSLVRRTMATQHIAWNYDQNGVVATLQLQPNEDEFENNSTAWQRFCKMGIIAVLPLAPGYSSLVWSTSPSHAKALLEMDESAFTDTLNSSLWTPSASRNESMVWLRNIHNNCADVIRSVGQGLSSILGSTSVVRHMRLPPTVVGVVGGSRASFPLGLGHAVHYVAPRVVLVGDAAHRIHPLAGHGVNLGLGDVAALTDVLEEAVSQGCDVGSILHLHMYETRRQRENVIMMGMTDTLKRLYSTSAAPVVLLRSLGLIAVDSLQPLKNRIEAYVKE